MIESFEWDDAKAAANWLKHSVSFKSVTRIFSDPYRLECFDERMDREDRFRIIGLVASKEVVVVYTMRGASIRIISAREASRHELLRYWQNRSLCLRPQ